MARDYYWVLDGKTPIPWKGDARDCPYLESKQRRVAETEIPGYWVSTVFMQLDHQFGDGPPLVFETMVFEGDGSRITDYCEKDCQHYSTWEEAEKGHAAMVEKWRKKT